jgi:hypothetical protein
MDAAGQQLGPDLVLEVANLPAQRRLGSVEAELCGGRQAAFLDDGHEITQVSPWPFHACEVWRQAYRVFFRRAMSA